MKLPLLTILFLLNAVINLCRGQVELIKIREWKKLDFKFPTAAARSDAIKKGQFVPENAFPIDVDVDYYGSVERSRIFVTIPRFSEGIPVTLGYVNSPSTDLQITPYPDYSWHSSHGANCDRLTSVLRVAIDSCDQLWVLDTGKIGDVQKCPPQLFVFDLRSNRLVHNYKFPSSQYTKDSLFINPILDVKNPSGCCKNTKVYIADVTGFALIVYDYALNKSWKIQNKLFNPESAYGKYTIAGESFDLMDGLFGLALSPKCNNRYNSNSESQRQLYFHSLASGTENSVPLSLIDNPAIWEKNANAEPNSFKVLGTRKIQTAAEAMDRNGNLYFVLMNPIAVACWDSSTPYNRDNIKVMVQDDQSLQFASGMKVIENLFGEEELWIMTIRFQKIANGNLKFDETNFRIQSRNIDALLRGRSKCNGVPLSYY